jgi:hypothetical protein
LAFLQIAKLTINNRVSDLHWRVEGSSRILTSNRGSSRPRTAHYAYRCECVTYLTQVHQFGKSNFFFAFSEWGLLYTACGQFYA